ncbi:ArnT family glycosyltransferase [Rhizobium sp. YIM 134829]|uniref:ArnT family glycosyltransferase n=1 Tax=Rhizobium sp. YIM 134829 TaxID=3390453 RepID=UPI0039793AC3
MIRDAFLKRPALFPLLICGYFALQVVLRLLLPHELELDEAQQSLLSQWLAWGYDTQPPLYNWIYYAVAQLFGNSLASMTIVKNLLLAGTYLLYYGAARAVLAERGLAMVAALGLLAIPHLSFESQRDLTHSVAMNFAAALFLFALMRTLRAPSLWTYLLLGLATGIGLIAKYNFALLLATSGLAALLDAETRKRVFDWRILLSAVVALLILSPHAFWLIDNLTLGSDGSLDKLREGAGHGRLSQIIGGLLSILEGFAGYAALVTVLFVVLFGKRLWARAPNQTAEARLIERMLAIFLVLLLALVLLAGASAFKERWLSPVLITLPLYAALRLEAAGTSGRLALSRFLPAALIIMVLIPTVLALRVVGSGWTGNYQKINVAYSDFAQTLRAERGAPAAVIAQDPHLAGNLRLHLPESFMDARWYPTYAGDDSLPAGPILVVWRASGRDGAPIDPAMPSSLSTIVQEKLGPTALAAPQQVVALPFHYSHGSETYRFAYAWIDRN